MDRPSAGDIFIASGHYELYEISEVTSDTEIKLDRTFTGDNSSNTNYAIIRHASASDITHLNLALSALIQRKDEYISKFDDLISSEDDTFTWTDRFGEEHQLATLNKYKNDLDDLLNDIHNIVTSKSAQVLTDAGFVDTLYHLLVTETNSILSKIGLTNKITEIPEQGSPISIKPDQSNYYEIVLGLYTGNNNRTPISIDTSTLERNILYEVTLVLEQSHTGLGKVDFLDDIKWIAGMAPVLSYEAGSQDVVTLMVIVKSDSSGYETRMIRGFYTGCWIEPA
ncbi:hypothetical protein [Gayadomonas joobiniege]|uniref:hypothetical protein n=1 Tax=Gayadomonas joobiniege TaxID=1234606 RepID=UPI00036A9EC0|nr:hypothetical protein [Gayadomonas joobiniege]